jgi:HD superfamily phosphohydrolase
MVAELNKSEFRDPIHGFIDVWEHEKLIIATPEFQRLRRIHQLGLESYVYHGAEHSRFGHCIGVMHLAGEAVAKIFDKNKDDPKFVKVRGKEKEALRKVLYYIARLAGLLHDIGHAPFSHPGEDRLFKRKIRHEDYTIPIIKSSTIASIIDEYKDKTGVGSQDVIDVLDKHGIYGFPFVKQLIASDFDVDKMDYLLRDSMYCGVEYGKYDLRRLIDTLTLDKGLITGSYQLAIHKDGLHTVEALILARYFMFTQVYFHKIRRAYDIILTDFIGDCLKEEYGKRTYPEPDEVTEYLKWDDNLILTKAKECANEANKNLAWRIIDRHHYEVVHETYPHPNPLESRKVDSLIKACRKKFKGTHFWLDPAVGHPEMFRRQDLPIMDSTGRQESLINQSVALRGLEEINYRRVYADVKEDQVLCQRVNDFCEDFMSK